MKTILPLSLRYFLATIICLLALLFFCALWVDGFQISGIVEQHQPSRCRSRMGTSAFTVSNQHAFLYTVTRKSRLSAYTETSRKSNRMQRTILSMAIPSLDKWKVISNGSVIGTVRNHPAIADGDVITTSPIQKPERAKRQMTVTTASGSKYYLLEPRGELSPAAKKREAKALAEALAAAEEKYYDNNAGPSLDAAYSTNQQSPRKQNWFGGWPGPFKNPAKDESVNGSSAKESLEDQRKNIIRRSPEWQDASRNYNLNGETIGLEDEYLLANNPERSTSGKSNIWEAYKADESTGLPVENAVPVCLKISTNLEAISREYENYRKLSFLGFWETGRFVRCYEFFPVAGYEQQWRNQCALAIEKGDRDLKCFLTSRGKLENKELRDACSSAAQCVQALHNAGLVWTDMKTENFVVMGSGEVKGIDLESAMPIGDYPVDYSPEACPPEFAAAFLDGDGPYFELDTSYDVWSLGMLMLELSTGRGYFDGKTPAQITKELRDMDEDKMADEIDSDDDIYGCIDNRLKDLIKKCLQKDGTKRPNTSQILMHPYFLAGNPFAFFSLMN